MSGWRTMANLLPRRRRRPAAPELVPGERYVCDLSGRGERLADLELVRIDDWIGAYADGVLHHGVTATFRGARGDGIEILRENVLWHRDDHPLIVVAAAALALPLVPPRGRGVPRWRLGSTRVEVADMVELGRLLTGRR